MCGMPEESYGQSGQPAATPHAPDVGGRTPLPSMKRGPLPNRRPSTLKIKLNLTPKVVAFLDEKIQNNAAAPVSTAGPPSSEADNSSLSQPAGIRPSSPPKPGEETLSEPKDNGERDHGRDPAGNTTGQATMGQPGRKSSGKKRTGKEGDDDGASTDHPPKRRRSSLRLDKYDKPPGTKRPLEDNTSNAGEEPAKKKSNTIEEIVDLTSSPASSEDTKEIVDLTSSPSSEDTKEIVDLTSSP